MSEQIEHVVMAIRQHKFERNGRLCISPISEEERGKAKAAITAAQECPPIPDNEMLMIKMLLRLLWITFDSGGISMGRSYQAVLLEAALELMDEIDCPSIEFPGDKVNEIRNYLSDKFMKKLNVSHDLTPTAPAPGQIQKVK